jgi:hypothetical protein
MGASEALPVPWFIFVCHTPRCNDLVALDASRCKFFLIAPSTINLLLPRNETLGSNRGLAYTARKTFLVPLPSLVLHFLRTCTEDFTAPVTSRGKLGIIAIAAVNLLCLGAELFVNQRYATFAAKKTGLVPMLLFVRQVLGVNAYELIALIASIRKNGFIAFNTIWMIITEDISLSS